MVDSAPELARALARGRPEAFSALYARHGPEVYRFLWGAVRHRETAEDLLQTVWLRLVRYRRRLGRVADLRAYVFAVARNELRRAPTRPTLSRGDDPPLAAHPPPGAEPDESEGLRAALAALPPEQREVVELKTWHRLTFAQIGSVLAIPPNTAASRYRLALADLARRLEERVHVAG